MVGLCETSISGAMLMKWTMALLAATLLFSARASAQQFKVTGHNYVTASGQWKSDAEATKDDPPAKVKIECDKNISLCAIAQGANLVGTGNLFTRLDVTPVHYTILRWDNTGVVAQTLANECATERLVIDFRTKSVTLTETPKSGMEEKQACKNFDRIVTSRLINASGGEKQAAQVPLSSERRDQKEQ